METNDMNKLDTIRIRSLTTEERSRTWETISERMPTTPVLSPLVFPLRKALSLAAVFIFIIGTVSISDSARPGQILFPVDIAVERVESSLDTSSQVDHAHERLAEFDHAVGNAISQEPVLADVPMEKTDAPETMMLFSMEKPAQAVLSEETENAITTTRDELHKILNKAAREDDTDTLTKIIVVIDEFEARVRIMRGQ